MSTQTNQTLAAGVIAFTVATIAAEATRYARSDALDASHGTKYADFAMMAVIISMSIGTARGED
jgi:hypothetical protein